MQNESTLPAGSSNLVFDFVDDNDDAKQRELQIIAYPPPVAFLRTERTRKRA